MPPLTIEKLRELQAQDARARSMTNLGNAMLSLAAPWGGMPQAQPPQSAFQNSLQLQQWQQQQGQQTARSKLMGGYDPESDITWNQGRPGLLGSPEGVGLLAQASPEAFMGAMTKQMFAKPSERQQKIKELQARGLSQSKAEDVASGRIRMSTHPVSGAIQFGNVATETVTQPRGQSALPKKTQRDMATRAVSIDALLDKMPSLQSAIEKGVGLMPVLKELGGRTLGQLPTGSVDVPFVGKIGTGEEAVYPEVVQARTQLRIFREDIIAAFRKSGKVPVQEQNRILEFVDKLGALESVADAKLGFQQLETELRRVRDTYETRLKGSDNPYSKMTDQEVLDGLREQGYDIGQ